MADTFLVTGATLKCCWGSKTCYLAKPAGSVDTGGLYAITELDCVKGVNITSFGMCKSANHPRKLANEKPEPAQGFPCVYAPVQSWMETSETNLNSEKLVTMASYLMCAHGNNDAGDIEPIDDGQNRLAVRLAMENPDELAFTPNGIIYQGKIYPFQVFADYQPQEGETIAADPGWRVIYTSTYDVESYDFAKFLLASTSIPFPVLVSGISPDDLDTDTRIYTGEQLVHSENSLTWKQQLLSAVASMGANALFGLRDLFSSAGVSLSLMENSAGELQACITLSTGDFTRQMLMESGNEATRTNYETTTLPDGTSVPLVINVDLESRRNNPVFGTMGLDENGNWVMRNYQQPGDSIIATISIPVAALRYYFGNKKTKKILADSRPNHYCMMSHPGIIGLCEQIALHCLLVAITPIWFPPLRELPYVIGMGILCFPPGLFGIIYQIYCIYVKGYHIDVDGENIVVYKWFKKKREIAFSDISYAKQRWVRTVRTDKRRQVVNGYITHYDVYDHNQKKIFKVDEMLSAGFFAAQLKEYGLIH